MNETLRHVQELGALWSGPYPSSPYKMDKIVDTYGEAKPKASAKEPKAKAKRKAGGSKAKKKVRY